jgi:RNA polymerase sigma-70 factor, ECF subfamily
MAMQREPLSAAGAAGAAVEGGGSIPDDELVAAMARGERPALAHLYDRHASLLLALGVRILGNKTVAEEVLGQVFLEAWHQARSYEAGRGTPRAWLVARMRDRALERRRQDGDGAQGAAGPAGVGPRTAGMTAGMTAGLPGPGAPGSVAGLPPELGLVVEMVYFEGLTVEAAAGRLQLPVTAVTSQMAEALAVLRQNRAAQAGRP